MGIGGPSRHRDGTFYLPFGIAPAPDGTVYVADLYNRVQRF